MSETEYASGGIETEVDGIGQEELDRLLAMCGRDLVVFESSYWGNEVFGSWNEAWLVSTEVETEKAYKLERPVELSGIVRRLREYQEGIPRAFGESGVDESEGEGIERQMVERAARKAWGSVSKRYEGGWAPKSAIESIRKSGETADWIRVYPDCSGGAVDVVVREEITVGSRWGRFRKLAVDCGYEVGQTLKEELAWEEWHMTAEYDDVEDEFVCWTVDGEVEDFVDKILGMGLSIGVDEEMLEDGEVAEE